MLTDAQFDRVVRYVKIHYGIDLSQKRILVNGRLETHFLHNGYDSFEEFMSKAEMDFQGAESKGLIDALTTNHTYFLREQAHFEYLRQVILPYLKVKEEKTRDLGIWSAASSTGEEPYTLAMVVSDFFGLEAANWDTRILATDISTRVLEHAVKGVYLKEQIDPLPEIWKRRYFINHGEEYAVRDELKKQLIFRRFNLMDEFPFKRKFHVVFLRNVMIYFNDDVKYRLIDKIYRFMEPGGYLIIGATESLDKNRIQFKYVQPSIYRKKE